MTSKVYLITGSNRGIGLSLTKNLSTRPNVMVIATARQPEKATELNDWAMAHSNVHVLKYDASVKEDAYKLAGEVEKFTDGIDVLIANAAFADGFYKVIDLADDLWVQHYNVNVLGPIFLFKAFYEILKKRQTRQVVFISSVSGSISGYLPIPQSAYGQSKAALNYSMKEISYETKDEDFTVISLHPGVVDSDMGKEARKTLVKISAAFEDFFIANTISANESAIAQIKVIDELVKEDTGKFFSYDGTETAF